MNTHTNDIYVYKVDYSEIISNEKGIGTYLHTTSKVYADLICQYGFLYADCISHTTDEVTKDSVGYWHRYRRRYGDCTIVIQTPFKELNINKHPKESKFLWDKLIEIDGDFKDAEFEYYIPPKYILGYIMKNKLIKC